MPAVQRHILLLVMVVGPAVCELSLHAQSGQASFQGLGDLPGGLFNSSASDVSADGRVVVGTSHSLNGSQEAFRWERLPSGSIMVGLGSLVSGQPFFFSQALGVNADGSVVVGWTRSPGPHEFEGFRWTAATGTTGMGGRECFDIATDGTIVGSRWTEYTCNKITFPVGSEAAVWPGGAGPVGLGFLAMGGALQSGAVCVSENAGLIAGNSRWTLPDSCAFTNVGVQWSGGGMSQIGAPPGAITDVSPDGAALVGLSGGSGFVRINGTMTTLPGTLPRAVSSGGAVVVGNFTSPQVAFVWDAGNGTRNLKTVLEVEYGLDLTGWTLQTAQGISNDGATVVGTGLNRSGQTEAWIAHMPVDVDADGLLDDWEINGIPYTDSTGIEQRYILSFDGDATPDCNVNRKDIFVEVDAMTGLAPSSAAFTAVQAAFNAAPVSNPNGAPAGIKLHVIQDDLNIPVGDWTSDDTNGNLTADWPTEFDALKLSAASGTSLAGYFGTAIERNDPDGAGIREARAKAFRYCIVGRSLDAGATTTGPGGIGEIGGNDFAITMGTWAGGPTINEHAGMFMHELGHTLGLRHGGGDDIHYKPNYYSVMNYAYTTPKQWMPTGTWPLESGRGGFSRFALLTLNENALNECVAQVTPGSALAGTIYVCSYVASGTLLEWHGRYDVANDWNNSAGGCKDPVAEDINRLPVIQGQPNPPPSPGETLNGHDDWAAIDPNFRDSPCFASGVHNSGLGEAGAIDITFEQNQALNTMLPPHCAGDIINDRSVNINDLLAVISGWGACPQGCAADIAPLPTDGAVNVNDLLAVISMWGDCP